jgi:hypothetical protein
VFASWIALFALQTSLVVAGRTDLRKKLGFFGAALAVPVFVMAYAVMLEGLHRGFVASEQDEAQILALDVVGINVSFAMFAAGLLLRRSPVSHKRLMFFGTVEMVGPAIARWPIEFIASRPPLVGLLLQLFAVAAMVFDLLRRPECIVPLGWERRHFSWFLSLPSPCPLRRLGAIYWCR